jgi:hypothetical protein
MRVKYTVIGIQMATREDRTLLKVPDRVSLYRVQVQADLSKDRENRLSNIPMHDFVLSKDHPKIGDTYTMIFNKDCVDE